MRIRVLRFVRKVIGYKIFVKIWEYKDKMFHWYLLVIRAVALSYKGKPLEESFLSKARNNVSIRFASWNSAWKKLKQMFFFSKRIIRSLKLVEITSIENNTNFKIANMKDGEIVNKLSTSSLWHKQENN